MNDTSDGGRRASPRTSPATPTTRSTQLPPRFLGGHRQLRHRQLTGGSLNFLNYDDRDPTGNSTSQFREYAIPLSTLGLSGGGNVDFIVGYIADSGYGSNESMPGGSMNTGGNVGDGTVSAGYPISTASWSPPRAPSP